MIRVAIVAESPRLRSELGELLRERECFDVIASVTARDEFRTRDSALLDAADVVLTEVTAAASLSTQGIDDPNVAWVLLSDDDELVRNLSPLRGGLALLPTTATAHQIVAAIEAAAAGLTVVHPDHARTGAPSSCDLTPREREVLHMLAAGLGNKEIASRLTISDHTAKFHVSQILGKLNAATRAEAVSIAIRRGLVPL
jgi:two-component system, NarL family, response regulator YdfI